MIDEDALAVTARRLYQQVEAEVESAIERRVARRAGAFFHFLLEILFVALPAVLLYRLAKNFFYDHLWQGLWTESSKPLLGIDFLIQAALWVLVWGLLLRGWLAWRLQSGLKRDLSAIAERLTPDAALGPLFSEFGLAATTIRHHAAALTPIRNDAKRLRDDVESSGQWQLGRLRNVTRPTSSANTT